MDRIARTELGFIREPLIQPFGFKGASLTELWQIVARLATQNGCSGLGIGVQSVLWSDPRTFCSHTEAEGNRQMLALTRQALNLLEGECFTDPPSLTSALADELLPFARRLLGRQDVPLTFVLNALVPVDFALWQIWNEKRGDGTFGAILKDYGPENSGREDRLGSIPLISYNTTEDQLRALLEEGSFMLKVKIGSNPGGSDDPERMLAWDIERLRTVHRLASGFTTAHTDCGYPVYYLDANGRYPNKMIVMRLLDAADKMGALERIVLLEEPLAEDSAETVHDLPVLVAGDERAHSAEDVRRLTGELGYGAIALKPAAKTLSFSLDMLRTAEKSSTACFIADLTVPPVLLDWNLSMAACLPHLPGLRAGVVESNGPQNYGDWAGLDAMCPTPGAAWRTSVRGMFELDRDFHDNSGIFKPSDPYAEILK